MPHDEERTATAQGDAFVGYHLRGIETALESMLNTLTWMAVRLDRIDRKVDALSNEMTPAERMALVQKINTEASEVSRVATEIKAVAASMDQSAQS